MTEMENWNNEMSATSRVTTSKTEQGSGKNREKELSWFRAYPFSLKNFIYIWKVVIYSYFVLALILCQIWL